MANTQKSTLFALKNFDSLPDSACVTVQVVAALKGCSVATVYREVKRGNIAPPVKSTMGASRFVVGTLRQKPAVQAGAARE